MKTHPFLIFTIIGYISLAVIHLFDLEYDDPLGTIMFFVLLVFGFVNHLVQDFCVAILGGEPWVFFVQVFTTVLIVLVLDFLLIKVIDKFKLKG